MFLKGAIRLGARGRRNAIFAATMVAILSIPLVVWAFTPPPAGETGNSLTGSTCGTGSCHNHGTTITPGNVTATGLPTTYTPGSTTPIPITVTFAGGANFSFEMSALSGSGTTATQAGSFTAGSGEQIVMGTGTLDAAVQYIEDTSRATSFTVNWTPPATNVGTVTFNLAGATSSSNINASTYTMTPAVVTTPTLTVTPTTINATVNGAEPADQPVTVTSSGASVTVTGTVSTTSCGNNWLTVMNPSGPTPLNATVHFVATGLSAGTTCTGSVSFAATGVSNSPQTVSVTLNVVTAIPPAMPTLNLSSTGLNFTATLGSTNAPSAPSAQTVMVTTSAGSAVTFNDAPTSTGNWLTVGGSTGTGTGTTPASESVGVVLTGLAAGTYNGHVTFTSSAVSNSSVTLPVTLTVNNPSTTPPPTSETFSLVVVDRQSTSNGGGDWLLLDGSGSVNSSGTPSGSGIFTRFRSTTTMSGGENRRSTTTTTTTTTIVSTGTWKPTSAPASYTPISGSTTGGTMVIHVQMTPNSFCSATATSCTGILTITSTGTTAAGVKLQIDGGAIFNTPQDGNPAVLIGTVSIRQGSGGGTGGGGGGTDE